MERIHYNKAIPINILKKDKQFFYIDDLQKTCVSINLSPKGKKKELLQRIKEYINNNISYLLNIDKDKWKGDRKSVV